MPTRALSLTIEWAMEHRAQFMEDWDLCQANSNPRKSSPWSGSKGPMESQRYFRLTRASPRRDISGRHQLYRSLNGPPPGIPARKTGGGSPLNPEKGLGHFF
ncbi:MAG: hypothetical protein RBS40_11225 [Rhodocyclaceae bacterium]|nr:hypothetical protein [Rhodocyclaceae bacterium]